jgi:hypothetical protein
MFTLECQLREQITELEETLSSTVSARDLTIRDLKEELRQARDWEDVDDEWTERIKAAHPTRSGSHDEYRIAMRMVGHRHSKGELVALVNWLLVQGGAAADEREACAKAAEFCLDPQGQIIAAIIRRRGGLE